MEIFEIKRREQNQGSKFDLRENSSDKKAILDVFKNNAYQYKTFKIGTDEKWLDLGANVGAFSVFAKSLGNQSIAFEADSDNLERCKVNFKLNDIEVEIHQAAVVENSYSDNSITFYSANDPEAGNQWRNTTYKPARRKVTESKVPILRFEDLKKFGYDCIKMDIEGSEINILQEKPDVSWVNKMAFEWSFDKNRSISKLQGIVAWLKENFDEVLVSKRLECCVPRTKDGDSWCFNPPCCMVYCQNKKKES